MWIIIWNKLEQREFVSWTKYNILDYVIKNWEEFRKWINVIFNDPDDWEEFIWEIDFILITEDWDIQAWIKDIAYWRVDLDILELY